MNVSIHEIKTTARGQWNGLLIDAGLPADCLQPGGHPCPLCGGDDRFGADKDVNDTGAVFCRHCFNKSSTIKPGDGVATVAWLMKTTNGEAAKWIADRFGMNGVQAEAPNGEYRLVATYDYCDEAGEMLYQVVRMEPKSFRQRKSDGKGGWKWSVKGSRVVPYRLLDLLAKPGEPIFIPEGERDCDNLAQIGLLATCNAGGAGKWTAEHSAYLQDRHIIILPDNDDPGRYHAQLVAQSLQGVAASVKIVELPRLQLKGDVSDWLLADGTKLGLESLVAAATIWEPEHQAWPELMPFDAIELPEFPTDALPDVLKEWVESESHATQTPADLAALLSLAVCSACIARRVVVEPRAGWTEPVNLFTAVLLEPGNRKSAVFSDAMKPLRELEVELIENARPDNARRQSDRRQDETQLRKLEKQAVDKHGEEAALARHEAGELAAKLANEPEPVLPRLLVDDATAEKLGILLSEQGGRIASMSPEGGVFDLMAGLYSKSGIPQFGVYLMGHSGDDLITDRVSRKSVRVEHPALTCAYAMQPAVIEGLAGNAAFRGRGLLARFLYSAPRSWIGRREIATEPVPEAMREAYRQMVRRLFGDLQNIQTAFEPFTLRLTHNAVDCLIQWETEIEEMLADGGDLEIMRDWGAKLAGATGRIAAILHCVEFGIKGQIDSPTIMAAIEIARYLIPHAEAVLQMMLANDDSQDDPAQYVLKWINRHKKVEFTKTEVQQHGKRKFPKADDIDPALAKLVRRGYIRPKPTKSIGPGRPASPAYEVNPVTFESTKPEKRSAYSKNSPVSNGEPNLENIQSAFGHIEVYSERPQTNQPNQPNPLSNESGRNGSGELSRSVPTQSDLDFGSSHGCGSVVEL